MSDETEAETPNENVKINAYRLNYADVLLIGFEFAQNVALACAETAEVAKSYLGLHSTALGAARAVKQREKLTRSARKDFARLR